MLTIKGIFLGLIGCNIIMSCILESIGALLYFISYWGDVSTFFRLPSKPLWQINMVLTMAVEAFVELNVYIESIPTEKNNPYVMRKDDIVESLRIASDLLDRLTYQYEGTSTVKRDADLNTVLSVPETPIPEFVSISSSHNYASSFPTESK